ncbi:MAG: acetyl-CoA carboxylase carboxyltransferase subunit alpha [Candidatus Kapabacteria bacterium]|nr:acetyl-CoA carboxylase carboxyltransferase subunit alpha [Ignavibacteriota bacterium]MCW5883978.1 acetyl-CoA carboxylase carboxyltransferase subunit alpha [Candidatus Kapabacteria bacterium]
MASKLTFDFEKPIIDLESKIAEMRDLGQRIDISKEINTLESKIDELRHDIYDNLNRWQRVQIARHPDRPSSLEYIQNCFDSFTELHGDRKFKDDPAIIGGFATINKQSFMVVGHQKGVDTKSNVYRNFGMSNPEGYRKAARLFKLAEKFGKPIITLLDTPGAFPGIEAEERGQAEAIAANLLLMNQLKVPVLVIVIGEGASGGAIGIGVGDKIFMLENSWYSVISPESCSSILWRSWDYKEQAAEALQLSANDLKKLNVIDEIIPEPLGGAHKDRDKMFAIMKETIIRELNAVKKFNAEKLLKKRREKFYSMGVWEEAK